MEQLKEQMSRINGEDLEQSDDYKEERITDLNQVQKEIRMKCYEIKGLVDEVRALVAKNLVSPENYYGCLRGSIDDYMVDFAYSITRIEQKLENDRNSWLQVKHANESKLAHLRQEFDKF